MSNKASQGMDTTANTDHKRRRSGDDVGDAASAPETKRARHAMETPGMTETSSVSSTVSKTGNPSATIREAEALPSMPDVPAPSKASDVTAKAASAVVPTDATGPSVPSATPLVDAQLLKLVSAFEAALRRQRQQQDETKSKCRRTKERQQIQINTVADPDKDTDEERKRLFPLAKQIYSKNAPTAVSHLDFEDQFAAWAKLTHDRSKHYKFECMHCGEYRSHHNMCFTNPADHGGLEREHPVLCRPCTRDQGVITDFAWCPHSLQEFESANDCCDYCPDDDGGSQTDEPEETEQSADQDADSSDTNSSTKTSAPTDDASTSGDDVHDEGGLSEDDNHILRCLQRHKERRRQNKAALAKNVAT